MSPSMESSYPKAINALAFSSSFHLDTMKCLISGWLAFKIFSLEDLRLERFMPAPEPPEKIIISVRYHSAMDSLSSVMDNIKQAEHWGFFSTPTLNQTGELNEAR